ncbi:hypothetical protein DBV15_01987 [Temnothorax longispinosus]|uniref:Uncharacterized protein n=1 Tax=Temnothorax longispinosus TaxID=300112 RepID=A0A4V3SAM1_9HYME|nr:hypothetical protein DBV15_01987 [Temnothorax longispinosus]
MHKPVKIMPYAPYRGTTISSKFIISHEAKEVLRKKIDHFADIPQHNRGVVSSFAIPRAPGEALLMKTEVFRQGDDGERRALIKSLLEGAGHLAGTPPPEPFVVLDIAARLLATWRYCNDKICWLTQADKL